MSNLFLAFLLTIIAGASTGLGGLVPLFFNIGNKKFLAISLSFSAGVMLYIAFAELFLEAFELLEYAYGDGMGYVILTGAFFGGIAIMAIIDRFIPGDETHTDMLEAKTEQSSLKRTGISTAVAIAIHNFPEGLITFVAALYDPAMGIAIAIAIIIHNIPEGIAMSAPMYHATCSKAKALLMSAGAGMTEPLGALVAWLVLRNVVYDLDAVIGIIFAAVGGIMVFVAIHQLLPSAQKYGKHHLVMKWMFAGMAVMAASLVVLELLI